MDPHIETAARQILANVIHRQRESVKAIERERDEYKTQVEQLTEAILRIAAKMEPKAAGITNPCDALFVIEMAAEKR